MQRAQFMQNFDTAVAADATTLDRRLVTDSIAAVTRLAAWCDSQQIAYAQALAKMGAAAEDVMAKASRSDSRDSERVVKRADTANKAPAFGQALAAGTVAAGHLDHLGNSLRRLDTGQQASLLSEAPRLLAIAAHSTPDEFARALRAEERRLANDDGMARLERQRSDVRLHRRTDMQSGMHIFTLTVDPVTGLMLHNKVNAAAEALFHDKTPTGCPTDPIEKQAFLRAHALLDMIEGRDIRLGKPEIVAVVDTTVTDPVTGQPTVDWGLPVEIPHQVLLDLFAVAEVHTVVVRNGIVLHAPGELNLGHTTRLANRAQRRALRGVYSTCAIPGCATRFELCKLHHVHWWRHGGHTNLNNLLPICVKHHTLVHHGGWNLHLAPDRTLTVTLPDRTTMTSGPPRRHAA